jgi:hypothetical protein
MEAAEGRGGDQADLVSPVGGIEKARSEKAHGDKHHYIPKFYLTQWTGDDLRLCEFSRPYKDVVARRKYPDATAYERGLYTFNELSPAISDYIEQRFLQHADNLAYAVLLKLLEGNLNDLTRDMRSGWSRFIMTLIHRTPEGIKRLNVRFTDGFRAELEQFRPRYEALRQSLPDPPFDEFVSSLTLPDLQQMSLHVLQRVMDSERTGTVLNGMIWCVITFDESHPLLLTGDRPMVMTNGIGHADSHLIMPISPRVLFVAANKQPQIDHLIRLAEGAGLAQRMNNRIARQARKYVYAVDEKPLQFIAPRLGEKAWWSPFE